jgi:hypothetical protein
MQRAFARFAVLSTLLSLLVPFGIVTARDLSSALNSPPTLTVPGPQTVSEGAPLGFTVSATDPDGQLVQLRASGLPAGATFRDFFDGTGSFSWTPDMFQAGSYLVGFTADDTFGGRDTKAVPIDVLNTNNAPVLDPIGDRSVERGGMLNVWISGYDPDGDAVSFSQTGLPSYGSFTDFGDGSASLVLAPPANQTPGTASMTIALTDGNLSTSETFPITVFALTGGIAPALSSIGSQTLAEGETRSVAVSATDADLDALTWTSRSRVRLADSTGSAPGASRSSISLRAAREVTRRVAVSDGSLSGNFTVAVTDEPRAGVD